MEMFTAHQIIITKAKRKFKMSSLGFDNRISIVSSYKKELPSVHRCQKLLDVLLADGGVSGNSFVSSQNATLWINIKYFSRVL